MKNKSSWIIITTLKTSPNITDSKPLKSPSQNTATTNSLTPPDRTPRHPQMRVCQSNGHITNTPQWSHVAGRKEERREGKEETRGWRQHPPPAEAHPLPCPAQLLPLPAVVTCRQPPASHRHTPCKNPWLTFPLGNTTQMIWRTRGVKDEVCAYVPCI